MKASEVIRTLQQGGWHVKRQKGSHVRLEHPDRPRNGVTVAFHSGRDVPAGTLHAILQRAGLSRHDFEELRKQ